MKKLYVGNLSFDISEEELHRLFEPYGVVESAKLATDRDTGRSRGFGFVEMSNDSEAESAIAGLDGSAAGGRALVVNEARPKASGSGGGYSRPGNSARRRPGGGFGGGRGGARW